jgi:AcrR family transcriptional regulator
MKSASANDQSLGREKWLESAIDAMTRTCMSKFNLDSLFRELTVGKGSFYYHFKNRTEFLLALVDYWERTETDNVIEALAALPESVSAVDKLWELMLLTAGKRNSRHELLIHSLSLESTELENAVKRVDSKRFNYLEGLFAEIGFRGDELAMRTHLFITATSMDHFIAPEFDEESFLRQLKLRHAFFIGK